MTRVQKIFLFLAIAASLAVLSARPSRALIQTQRSQISVTIVVNVTPSPVAYVPQAVGYAPRSISARFALRARGSQDAVANETISDLTNLVAQAAVQHSLKVQAHVTPNPLGTLLISNQQTVTMSGVAGTTIHQTCIFTVSVTTTQASWILRQGLSANFSSPSFPGSDLANDSYLQSQTPMPTSTPFIVYPTNWTILASSGTNKTYCVDLTLTIPPAIPGGTYSTNAIYTVFY